jgi:thioredoxin-related protein
MLNHRLFLSFRSHAVNSISVYVYSILIYVLTSSNVLADTGDSFIEFDDTPLKQDIILPGWFKLSFLELYEDLKDAKKNHKRGLILYFGQKDCPYCKAHLEKNWGDRGIVTYTRKNFDVVAIDVRGDRPVADFDGKIFNSEKEFAARKKTNFTPSLLFYNLKGKEIFRLSGYHPPYQFRNRFFVISSPWASDRQATKKAKSLKKTSFHHRPMLWIAANFRLICRWPYFLNNLPAMPVTYCITDP